MKFKVSAFPCASQFNLFIEEKREAHLDFIYLTIRPSGCGAWTTRVGPE